MVTKLRIGVGVSYYGPAAPAHRDSIRALKGKGFDIVELRGSAYPEMSYAELCRGALAEEVDVLVLASHRTAFTAELIEDLAQDAVSNYRIVSALEGSTKAHRLGAACRQLAARDHARSLPPLLSLTAIPLDVLIAMSEIEERTYTNTGVLDTGFAGKSRPFASPWSQQTDGSVRVVSLNDANYLTPEEALLLRAERAGFSHDYLSHPDFKFLGQATPSIRMTQGDAEKRADHDIPFNYAFCVPTFGGLDHDQQEELWQLEKAGCTIIEYRDCTYIDQARSYLTKLALKSGHDGVFFLDHDIMFRPCDALQVIAEAEARQDVVSGVYCMRKTAHSLIGATAVEVGTEVGFFDLGSVVPALYSGLGFSAIPKAVIHALDAQLPELWSEACKTMMRPYYALDVNGTFYSGEDASFCARVQGITIKMLEASGSRLQAEGASARSPEPEAFSRPGANPNGHDWDLQADASKALTRHKVWLDTRVRIFHRGSYDYGIEDHNIAVPRYAKLKATLVASRKECRVFLADKLSQEAQEVAQGIDVKTQAPHSILEEQGPCLNCHQLESTHVPGGAGCRDYREMTKLTPVHEVTS
jgi:hypothetical protein